MVVSRQPGSRAVKPTERYLEVLNSKGASRKRSKSAALSALRGVTKKASRSVASSVSSHRPRKISISEKQSALDIKLTALAMAVFGEANIIKLMSIPRFKIRKLWELSSPTTQCNNVIRKVGTNTICWICGYRIISTVRGLTGECDHILPIAQAIMFLSLYDPTSKIGRSHKAEYGWAHKLCNHVKSDMNPIVNHAGGVAVNEEDITELLRKIYSSKQAGHTELHKLIKSDEQTFVGHRTAAVFHKYKEIADIINGNDKTLIPLHLLGGIAGLFRSEAVHKAAHSVLFNKDNVIVGIGAPAPNVPRRDSAEWADLILKASEQIKKVSKKNSRAAFSLMNMKDVHESPWSPEHSGIQEEKEEEEITMR